MTRLSVPIESRLRNPKDSYGYGIYQDTYVRRLMLIAVAALYAKDGWEQAELYRIHKKNSSAFFADCVDGGHVPANNRIQELVSRICPKSTHLNLYIGVHRDSEPSHYVSLVKHVDSGLWRLRTVRLSAVRSNSRLPRDGIQAYWKTGYTPLPDVAYRFPIYFSRIVTGGSGIHEMVWEIEDSPELQLQLTHCAMVCELFGNLRDDLITVRTSPGKAVFRVHCHDNVDSGFVTPYGFESVHVSPYAQSRLEKPNVIVWGNASGESLLVQQVPRSILPQIRNAKKHVFTSADGEEEFVSEVLLSRVLPFVGIGRGEDIVDIFGLSYNPDDRQTIVTAYAIGRRSAALTMIPTFDVIPDRIREWYPNHRAVEVLKCMLLELDTVSNERRNCILRLFEWLGVRKPEIFIRAFQWWRQPLGDEEIAVLAKCFRQ